jgi:hypothetical protein
MTNRIWMKGSAKGIDSMFEALGQRMLERRATRTVHDVVTGRGRMC